MYTKEFFYELPLIPKNYNLLHTEIKAGILDDMEAFKAYYDWFQRYGQILKPIIKHWFVESTEEFAKRFEE